MKIFHLIFVLLTILFPCISNSASISFIPFEKNEGYISLSGEIVMEDSPRFINLVNNLNKSKVKIVYVELDSPGGTIYSALEIADLIQKQQLNTVVLDRKQCGSACFVIFMAGNVRLTGDNVKLFVHRLSSQEGDSLEAKGLSVSMNDIYRELKVPDNIRIAMLDTPPSEVYILTQKDIDAITMNKELKKYLKENSSNRKHQNYNKPKNNSSNITQNIASRDLRKGIYATDQYYNSIQKYNTTSLTFNEAFRKLYSLIDYDDTGVPEYLIGKMYQDGIDGNKSDSKAWTFYEASAKKGNGLAIFRMGMYYKKNKMYDEAIKYIVEAIKLGVPTAVNYAGYMFETGILVDQDYNEAKKFYDAAFDLGSDQAAYAIANLYLKGIGVKKNLSVACKYLNEAISRGNSKAYTVYNHNCY